MENICNVCGNDILVDGDNVKCDGVCSRMVHAKCTGLTKTVIKAVNDVDNLCYICNECKSDSFKAINVKLNKILSFICIYDERVTRSEKNVSNLIEQVGEIKTLLSDNNVNKEDRRVIKNKKKAQSYAEKVKMGNNESVVTKSSKSSQNSSATESELKNAIDPTRINIGNLRKFPKGGIAIECKNVKDSSEVAKIVNEKMSDKYEVSMPELRNPRARIMGMDNELSEDELVKVIKRQNEHLADANMKVISIYNTKVNKWCAIIEFNSESFEKCMEINKLKVMWTLCRVTEDINVYRCFKCNGYNHKQSNCTNKVTCRLCAMNHHHSVCKSKKEECVNCKVSNDKLGLKLNTNHNATSEKCSVYKKRVETERRKIKYNQI